jgi:hypothetical protein
MSRNYRAGLTVGLLECAGTGTSESSYKTKTVSFFSTTIKLYNKVASIFANHNEEGQIGTGCVQLRISSAREAAAAQGHGCWRLLLCCITHVLQACS